MKRNLTRTNIKILLLIVGVFAVYNFIIYKTAGSEYTNVLSFKASHGARLWQANNCNSCHQLYGLGGYLGPDLTNVYTAPGKGPDYIKAFLNSGVKAMPKFHFSKEEQEALIVFLEEVDRSGYYPNYNADVHADGWVEIKYKNEK